MRLSLTESWPLTRLAASVERIAFDVSTSPQQPRLALPRARVRSVRAVRVLLKTAVRIEYDASECPRCLVLWTTPWRCARLLRELADLGYPVVGE